MATASPHGGVSPSSSPRLPSPPPFTEVQFGPKSPLIGASISELELEAAGKPDDGALRRIRPGTKAVDMAKGPPFVPLHQLESAFQLQEYLKTLYHKLTRDEASNTVKPISKEMAMELATPPTAADTGETVDRNLWLYELCRLLCAKTTRIIVAFFADNPPCSSHTCPEMRASEWQYLCAVHDPPKSCCAVDYCNHTLDWASNVLTSTKHFPSRLSLGGEGTNVIQSMRQLTNIFRRVYRIYAHAWFQHREVFWSIESELGLYMFFKTVCDVYQLIPDDNYTIPPDAEGQPEDKQETPISTQSPQRMQILQKENDQPLQDAVDSPANTTVTTGATTRRHKHTPSTGVPVAVIAEGTEEEDEEPSSIHASESASSTSTSTSPTKSTGITRLKSPGRIDLPPANDAERIPEDPTPLAQPEINPMEITINQAEIATPVTDTPPSLPPLSTEFTSHKMKKDADSQTVTSPNGGSFKVGGSDVLNAILGHMDDFENPDAQDDKIKTEATATGITEKVQDVAVKKDINTDENEEGNETMEKIEVPDDIVSSSSSSSPEEVKVEDEKKEDVSEKDVESSESKDGGEKHDSKEEKAEAKKDED